MKKSERNINKLFMIENDKYLSSHDITDIIGNYSKEDFCIEKKYYTNFYSFGFTLTLV